MRWEKEVDWVTHYKEWKIPTGTRPVQRGKLSGAPDGRQPFRNSIIVMCDEEGAYMNNGRDESWGTKQTQRM